ncbi:MAG: Uxx-star family glutaredoxin-like (seleno)protein [Minisyncoccia bacterium]
MTVKIYTTPTCTYCKMAKSYFQKNNIQYEEFNVMENIQAREEMVKLSHQLGVPVIVINNEVVVGFNKSLIDKLLKLK